MILAIDSATRVISMALHDGQRIVAEETWESSDHHTVELTPALQALLVRAAVSHADLTALAVARGPGSFTGLRIGMSLAKGLALAAQPPLPIAAIPTLDIVAAAQPHHADWLCAVAQAGRGRVNAGFYRWQQRWQADGPPFIATWPALCERLQEHLDEAVQVAGEIDAAGHAQLAALGERVIIASAAGRLRRAGYLAELACEQLKLGMKADPAEAAPAYTG